MLSFFCFSLNRYMYILKYYFGRIIVLGLRCSTSGPWAKCRPWSYCMWPMWLPIGWEIWQQGSSDHTPPLPNSHSLSPSTARSRPGHASFSLPLGWGWATHLPLPSWIGTGSSPLPTHGAGLGPGQAPFTPHKAGSEVDHICFPLWGWIGPGCSPTNSLCAARCGLFMSVLDTRSWPPATSSPRMDQALPIRPAKEKGWAPLL